MFCCYSAKMVNTADWLRQPILIPTFHLVHGTLSLLPSGWGLSALYMHNGFALYALHAFFPVLVVFSRSDKECKQHRRVHFADLETSDPARVTRLNIWRRVRAHVDRRRDNGGRGTGRGCHAGLGYGFGVSSRLWGVERQEWAGAVGI